MDTERLFAIGAPYFYLVEMDPSDFANLHLRLQEQRSQAIIRRVRGERSQDYSRLLYDRSRSRAPVPLLFWWQFGGIR